MHCDSHQGDSSDEERLDPNNGLPLVATLDALFDTGLVTFMKIGMLVSSERLDFREREVLGQSGLCISRQANADTLDYLAYHRDIVFR
jgi:hypothetical protein